MWELYVTLALRILTAPGWLIHRDFPGEQVPSADSGTMSRLVLTNIPTLNPCGHAKALIGGDVWTGLLTVTAFELSPLRSVRRTNCFVQVGFYSALGGSA
jgi:hypothetical protein